MRPRRSVLYMPAANARALEKAKTIDADAVIFDLEDAVAPDSKELARDQAVAAVASGEYGRRELTIRVNGLDTPWGADDLAAAASVSPAAVVVPKVDSAAEVATIAEHLDRGGADASVKIWPMIETPQALYEVRAIASSDRVSVLVMGTNDLIKELRFQRVADRHPVLPHLAASVLAARAAGVDIVDGVYNDVTNADGFAAEARQGFEMGFDGKTLIHPSQVGPTNEIWAPSDDDIEHARRVIAAFDEATADGRGVVTVDGRMIENLHVEEARRTLATAEAIAN